MVKLFTFLRGKDLIDEKLLKRRRNTYGPPLLKQQIFFVDDLNMPALDKYGAQPPIELIRQFMDFKGEPVLLVLDRIVRIASTLNVNSR